MSRPLYIQKEEQSENPLARRILIAVLLTVLAAALIIGVMLYLNGQKADQVLADFEAAMAGGRFADAVDLYRQAQEKALATGPLDRNQAQYQQALSAMEEQTAARLRQIQDKLLKQENLTTQDVSLAGDLAELSASRLITWLRGLCHDYLFGIIGRPVLEHAFSQLAGLRNISQAVQALPGEFDQLAAAQPILIEAGRHLADGEYWAAYDLYKALADDDSTVGYVLDQTLLLLEQCKSEMYQPLLAAAKSLMDGGRYLSAQAGLQTLAGVFPDDPAVRLALEQCAAQAPAQLSAYHGAIEFLTVKPLIVNPSQAFDGDAYAAAAADSMLTVGEFQAMLDQLYARQYILVDATSLYDADRRQRVLQLPPDKKPLVLVIEGLNYYATRRETGNAWDLVLDESGNVCATYPDDSGHMVVDRRGEAVGILDEFVGLHPDFALDGAKGTISLTGYECIFGRVTDADQLDDRNKALQDNGMAAIAPAETELAENRNQVQSVIKRLKETGWLFASSTYGFIDANSQNLERIKNDTEKWLSQVGSLTGPVSMLHYPNGAFIQGSDERAEYLKGQGFILFGGIGTTAYLYAGNNYFYVDKTPINGFTLRNSQTYQLERLFDVAAVYDAAARTP